MTTDGFYAKNVSCKVYYNEGWIDYDVYKLNHLKEDLIYFRNSDHYIKHFIEYIKDNVIKNLKDLNSVSIQLLTYDSNNLVHRLIVTVTHMISDLLKYKHKICFNKSVFVSIQYEDKLAFIGHINFTGLH